MVEKTNRLLKKIVSPPLPFYVSEFSIFLNIKLPKVCRPVFSWLLLGRRVEKMSYRLFHTGKKYELWTSLYYFLKLSWSVELTLD